MTPEKPAIRDLLKARLRTLTAEQRAQASLLAVRHVLSLLEYRQAAKVMLFISMGSEVDTSGIAADAWASSKRVLVPVTRMEDRSMRAVEITSLADATHKTAVGVLEPASGPEVAACEIDLVLVPGLGFGPSGQRLGRGAGFYDRFLSDPQLRAVKCGLAFEVQVIEGIPMTRRDVPLDMLVTEHCIRRFG